MTYICPKCGEPENLHFNLDYLKAERPVIDVLCNECGTTFKNAVPELRPINYGELHLILRRLAIDVLDNPNNYLPHGEGIDEFIRGEHRRRDLFQPEK
jgi:hypothetical protein